MAGRSHWSLSIEPHAGVAAFVFDVACRISADNFPDIRSTYRPAVVSSLLNDGSCVLNLDEGWRLTVRIENDLDTKLETGELGLIISPQQLTGPTRRWKYHLELVPGHFFNR